MRTFINDFNSFVDSADFDDFDECDDWWFSWFLLLDDFDQILILIKIRSPILKLEIGKFVLK